MCDLAKQLPLLVGGILEREKLLKRGRFREETMTDIFTGALVAFAGRNLVIEYPVEIDTGGDIDLRFWHVASGRSLNVRIQAKRLNAATSGKNLVKTKHRAYDELLHKSPTAKDYQFRVLRNSPAPWIPLYMFYNHESITRDREYAGKLIPFRPAPMNRAAHGPMRFGIIRKNRTGLLTCPGMTPARSAMRRSSAGRLPST